MRWVVVLVVLALGLGMLVQGHNARDAARSLDRVDVAEGDLEELAPVVLQGVARPPSPEPEREAETQEEDPPDPLGKGDAALELEFLDRETAAPRATGFSLWRLDAPGNEGWTRGDQRQVERGREVVRESLKGLPEGRYRLHLHHVAAGAADPPPFVVLGALTSYRFDLDPIATFQVHVGVYDENGARWARASRSHGRPHTSWQGSRPPDWVASRRLKHSDRPPFGGRFGGASAGSGYSSPKAVTAGEAGFLLGSFEVATRYASWKNTYRLELGDHACVGVQIANKAKPSRPLVALALSESWIREHIVLEDGRRIDETDLTLHTRCEAVEPEPGQDAWEAASVLGVRVEARRGWKVEASATLHLRDTLVILRP